MRSIACAGSFLRRLALVLLLLVTQQSGITHSVWHFARSVAHQTTLRAFPEAPLRNVPAQESLCPLHTALGAVLGVIAGDGSPATLAATEELHFPLPDIPAGVTRVVRPVSRGPPILL